MKLTTYLDLVPSLRMSGSMLQLPTCLHDVHTHGTLLSPLLHLYADTLHIPNLVI